MLTVTRLELVQSIPDEPLNDLEAAGFAEPRIVGHWTRAVVVLCIHSAAQSIDLVGRQEGGAEMAPATEEGNPPESSTAQHKR
jgi:hypothetical protein